MTKIPVSAGGGLLDRRIFLKAAATSGLMIAGLANAAWVQRSPGTGLSKVGSLSIRSKALNRLDIASQPGTDGSGGSRTPLEHLEGSITPSRLHFERHHSGIPNLTADRYDVKIFGAVQRASAFNLEDLHRFAMVSKVQFLECSGNSGALIAPEPVQASCGSIHGLVSCSEWTGVPVSSLLDAVGVKPSANWAIVDGADAGRMNRSIPLSKLYDDAIVALYQNGEPLRPENGYPARLFLPGWEGNTSIKWLRTLVLTDQPGYTREETSKYTDLYADGHADMFTFTMGVKSVITSPSLGMALGPKGRYQITGLAWSGLGGIKQVEVSADGGKTWGLAHLDNPESEKKLFRFRAAWNWQGQPTTLLSRATDLQGRVQPTRVEMMQDRAIGSRYHVNATQAWKVDPAGKVSHVYV